MQSNAAGVVTEKEKETKMYRNSFLFSRGLQPQEKKKKIIDPFSCMVE
jgi:hypothetical protein